MKDFYFKSKKSNSIKSRKRKNYFRTNIVSFNSEKDDSNNTINDTSLKPSNTLNNNNFINYNNSFQKNNNKMNFNADKNSKSVFLDNSNNFNNKKNMSSVKVTKSFSNFLLSKKSIKSNINTMKKNISNQNIYNSNISIENKNIINNNKILSLRNSANLNSRNFSTVKEEQEQTSKICEENNPFESPKNNINNDGLFKFHLFYEGKKIDLLINKNEKFKKLFLL